MRRLSPRMKHAVLRLTRTLWFVPLAMALAGVALGVVLPLVDALAGVRALVSGHRWSAALLASTPDGARQLLGTSAGALATILGVAFSLTLVALQLAAQQYTPRVIARLMDDRTTKVVLGAYLGTIAYLLLVLRVVHGSDGDLHRLVPWLSVVVGLLLILLCLGLLSAFINNLARSMQATSVITGIARTACRRVRAGEFRPDPGGPPPPEDAPVWLEAGEHGHVQVVDVEKIAQVAPGGATLLRVVVSAGQFVFAGQRLAAVWPARPLDERQIAQLRSAFVTGEARTPDQDLLFAVQQIVDIALKALSPAMNDETTAVLAVNQLGAIGVELARAGTPAEASRRLERHGVVVVSPALGMRAFVEEAFHPVIRSAGSNPRVLARLVDVLRRIAAETRGEDARRAVRQAVTWIAEGLDVLPAADRARVHERLAAAGGDRGPAEAGPGAVH